MRIVKLTTIILSILLVNCSNFQLSTISPFYEFYTDKDDRSCLSKYPDRLIFSSSSTKCQLNCSWFSSSSPEFSDYYNDNQVISYSLNYGKLCDVDSYCKSGSCVHLNDIPGRARLTIGQCFFPQKDTFTETDSYIKVYVDSKLSGFKLIGTTSIIYNNNHPNFGDDYFDSPLVSREGHFLLSISDADYVTENVDDFIARIKIQFTDCYMESEYCVSTFTAQGRYWLKYKISWTPII